ncbi:MAG: hypothetical protein NT129_02035 [Candidatus Aenigmarchaeota archaeon]|nr:hypothetical protein [Candidatus Aenigmarchaeota archaeon]
MYVPIVPNHEIPDTSFRLIYKYSGDCLEAIEKKLETNGLMPEARHRFDEELLSPDGKFEVYASRIGNDNRVTYTRPLKAYELSTAELSEISAYNKKLIANLFPCKEYSAVLTITLHSPYAKEFHEKNRSVIDNFIEELFGHPAESEPKIDTNHISSITIPIGNNYGPKPDDNQKELEKKKRC